VSKSAGAFLTKAKEGLESATMLIMFDSSSQVPSSEVECRAFFCQVIFVRFFFFCQVARASADRSRCVQHLAAGRLAPRVSHGSFEPGVFLALLFVLLEGICVDIAPEAFFWRGVFFGCVSKRHIVFKRWCNTTFFFFWRWEEAWLEPTQACGCIGAMDLRLGS